MKTSIQIELRPFTVPNFVIRVMPPGKREEGFKEAESYSLDELDPGTLEKMCDDFRSAVFTKAGKSRPPQPARER